MGRKKMENRDMWLDKMTDLEARAYKVCLLWAELTRKYFPNYKNAGICKGDPRKGLLFKYCYKLIRETVLDEGDYKLYIRAQLEILKSFSDGKDLPLISPSCLVGDRAWRRWKFWKRRYDELSKRPIEVSKVTLPGVAKAIFGLEKTKEFISSKFKEPRLQDFRDAYGCGDLFRWINFGKISPYYLAISPFMSQILKEEDYKRLNFDTNLYKPLITEEVTRKFKELFNYEK